MTKKSPIYRTVLSLAIAALLAATLPFSVMYVNAMSNRAVVTWKSGHAVVTTKTSGGQRTQLVSTAGSKPAAHSSPVTTRSS